MRLIRFPNESSILSRSGGAMPKTRPFDRYTYRYDKWFEDNSFIYRSEMKALEHFVPVRGNGIEIGVGSGMFASHLGIKYGVERSKALRRLA
jgi:hypothetical protein